MSTIADDLPLYEKLGAFYLGRPVDPVSGETAAAPLLYDSRDLVTHAVIVGMTGSGKTGLGVALLEEAALDGVPALVIDPKGDLTNLALAFPELRPEDFRPWLDPREIERGGDAEALAAARADAWRAGLAAWDQTPERVARLRRAAEVAIYTPGSSAGRPISILGSLAAPPAAVRDDPDLLAERVATWAASLLGLLGIDADPLTSREHILLSRVLGDEWAAGRSFDLAGLVQRIQDPGVARLGVMDLETFFPSRDRFALALRLNNLLAAPGMAAWLGGTPLDVARLLWAADGRPRLAVLSIAHLSDAERMFFVSLLLDEVVGWARSQSGTTSLRALLYMDEVYGYLPPVAAPPSKRPLLTLLKQARAYGLGVVLATQNPVDLDYKALSNAGTWFLGRLQTERDRDRVLDGLEGVAAGSLDRRAAAEILGGLGKRRFLLHDVHEPAPTVFETRWVMSYLAGPLTRAQIKTLPEAAEDAAATPAPPAAPTPPATTSPATSVATPRAPAGRPVLPPDVEQLFVAERRATAGERVYAPAVLGLGTVHYVDAKRGVEHAEAVALVALPDGDRVDWDAATPLAGERPADAVADAPAGDVATWGAVPSALARKASYAAWSRDLAEHLYRSRRLDLLTAPDFATTARPGEAERELRARLALEVHEAADRAKDDLRERHRKEIDRLAERLRKAEQRVARERDQAERARFDTLAAVGAGALGALFGRGRGFGGLRTTLRGVSRSVDQHRDVGRAEEDVAALGREIATLEADLARELAAVAARHDPRTVPLESVSVAPRRQDVAVDRVVLAWLPRRRDADDHVVDTWR